jgi:hypothetical protein
MCSELLEGEEGFALSQGTWQRDGWRELDDLRKKLEGLKELRELVRGLGRSGGKGPLRKAPEQVSSWLCGLPRHEGRHGVSGGGAETFGQGLGAQRRQSSLGASEDPFCEGVLEMLHFQKAHSYTNSPRVSRVVLPGA